MPKDIRRVQGNIRETLGSSEKIGNLRISSSAIEFDLFAEETDLEKSKRILENKISTVLTLKLLDGRPSGLTGGEILRKGVALFNEERFWEAHEILEEIWHPAKGVERDVIQGMILTAAALVHLQKDEKSVCASILERALDKLGSQTEYKGIDIQRLKSSIKDAITNNEPKLFKIIQI